jgi:lipopolysaccharide biosynthesis regulator YciM
MVSGSLSLKLPSKTMKNKKVSKTYKCRTCGKRYDKKFHGCPKCRKIN